MAAVLAGAASRSCQAAESDDRRPQVDALVAPLIAGELFEGLVVGILQPSDAEEALVDASGMAFFGYGRFGTPPAPSTQPAESAANDARPWAAESTMPDGDTLFEIGSITKPFTGLLLADMVVRGEVTLDEPVARLLPDSVAVPSRDGREITLVDLATHASGLPRMPKNFAPANPFDPYADYSAERMFEFLSTYELRLRKPGEQVVYSNLGVGLLGEALARRAQSDYESLLRERILTPLELHDTWMAVDAPAHRRLAPGHDADGRPSPSWNFQSMIAAGGIRSTARDMLKFLRANIYLADEPAATGASVEGLPAVSPELRQALALSHQPRHEMKSPPGEIALAWMKPRGSQLLWHNGQTGGYHCFAAFDRDQRTAVVVLCNSACGGIDDLGLRLMQLLAGGQPQPAKMPAVAQVDPALLAGYAGTYQLDNGLGSTSTMNVTVDQGRLWAQLELQPKAGIYPESDTRFFYKSVDAQIDFIKDDAGKVERLVLHQNGRDFKAERVPQQQQQQQQ